MIILSKKLIVIFFYNQDAVFLSVSYSKTDTNNNFPWRKET